MNENMKICTGLNQEELKKLIEDIENVENLNTNTNIYNLLVEEQINLPE